MTSSQLHSIAARAASLRERVDEAHRFRFNAADKVCFERRLDEWRKTAASGNDEMFARRLINDGISDQDLPLLLGDVTIAEPESLPSWIESFAGMMAFLEAYDVSKLIDDGNRLLRGDNSKYPFVELLVPFIAWADKRLSISVGTLRSKLLTDDALRSIFGRLAALLSWNAAYTWYLEFQVFKAPRQSSLLRMLERIDNENQEDTTLYKAYLSKVLSDHYSAFFDEYAVLARVMTITIDHWVEANAEMFQRLDADRRTIVAKLAGGVDPGRVAQVGCGISDAHNRGRSVAVLTFDSGFKLVYKPRNQELEQSWSEFMKWFCLQGLKPEIRTPVTLSMTTHGWVEFIEPRECESEQEVEDFYTRIGMLIGIVYLLGGNDFHHENMIASGAHPVLIDLESIMHHEGRPIDMRFADGAGDLAVSHLNNSVLHTGLLPIWSTGQNGYAFDISGVGAYDFKESPYVWRQWKQINTDGMRLEPVNVIVDRAPNLPRYEGVERLPQPYGQQIVFGFETVCRFMMLHRDEIPIHLFTDTRLRFIFRPTRVYALVRKEMMDPEYMRNGLDRSLRLEHLARAFLSAQAPCPSWGVFKSELRQMEEMDIPIFWSMSSGLNLEDASCVVAHEQMREEAYKQVEKRIQSLDEAEMQLQISYLRVSLFLREHEHAGTSTADAVTGHTTNEVQAPDADELIEAAMNMARTLGRSAIEANNGCCTWITVGLIPGTDRFRMQPMRLPLYDGLAGVALFLSALVSVTGDKDVIRLNNAAIRSLRNDTARLMELGRLESLMPLGIASGVSSVIYANLKIHELLNDESHLDDALNLAGRITNSMIDNDSAYDIISGSAGCLLALTALHEATGDARALETAVVCGNHLLEAHNVRDDAMEWRTRYGAMLTGFSHGAAGLAFALLRLFEHTGDAEYREAAEQAVAYENGYFDSGHENWPDLRNKNQKGDGGHLRFMTSWCHGATGIGLARLGALHLMDNDEIRSNIVAARHATEKAAMNTPDQLCCGIMGRVEFLSLLARSYNDTELMDSAMRITGRVLDRARANGRYSLFHDTSTGMQFAGFFQGLSGIGYQFLRLSQPDRIPNVLLFQ